MTGAALEDVAIAIAAEFVAIDPAAEHARLDSLAAGLGPLEPLATHERADALLGWLGRDCGFDSTATRTTEGLLIDRVLETRRGDPLLLAVVYSAVARRAGYRLYPAGTERFLILGDPTAPASLVIDPVPGGRLTPTTMRWLCPHLVGAMLCGALSRIFLERGELAEAIRAAELRLLLPFAPPIRKRFQRELIGLRARLN